MEFRNIDQNKQFIKKEAKRLGISVGAAYSTYYSRLLLERLAQINYGKLVVKGSFSQYVHLKELSRPVLDIDLSSQQDHEEPLRLLYQAMYEASDDIITFDLSKPPHQTPNGVYKIPGVAKIKYPNNPKEITLPINIDFKEKNEVIFETQLKAVEPLFEGDHKFYINTPSFEEHLAEKLYIVLHNRKKDIENTRVKDFYDIYRLYGEDYDEDKLALYFQMMLMMYHENLSQADASFLNKEYIARHTALWEQMKRKYEFANRDLQLNEAVYYAKEALNEQIHNIRCGTFTDQAQALVRAKMKK